MKKKKATIIIITLIVGVILSYLLFLMIGFIFNVDSPKIQASIIVRNSNANTNCDRVAYANDSNTYYYINGKDVCTQLDEQVEIMYNGNTPSLLSVNDSELFVFDDSKIIVLDIKTKEVVTTIHSGDVSGMFACDTILFYTLLINDGSYQLCAYDLDDNSSLNLSSMLTNKHDGYQIVDVSKNYQVIMVTEFGDITALEVASNEFSPVLKYNTYGLYEKDNHLVSFSVSSNQFVIESVGGDSQDIEFISLPDKACYSDRFVIDNRTFITIGTQLDFPPFQAEAVDFSPDLKNHGYDVILMVDMNTFEVNSMKTNRFERVLYADTDKAITYYDGEYLTYSMDGWEVIARCNADEIRSGGSYTFEACGTYIFVFDDASGELINRIEVS